MSELLSEHDKTVFTITFNRLDKLNAFDDHLLIALQTALDHAIANPKIRLIVLKAHGHYFSAGADVQWMQRMAHYSEARNHQDAMILAKVMQTLNSCPKPTIVIVQGAAFGGGAGLVAACDIAIAAESARFCFSEVKLGLIPAVISPYVIQAIGPRNAKWLFMTAELFDAQQAKAFGLVQYCIADEKLGHFSEELIQRMTKLAPTAIQDCKALVKRVKGKTITDALVEETAALIAKKRVSREGQRGLRAFLNKESIHWDEDWQD